MKLSPKAARPSKSQRPSIIAAPQFNKPTVVAIGLLASVVGIFVILRLFAATAPNMIANSTVNGPSGWAIHGQATYDSSVSHTADGSGSIKLPDLNSFDTNAFTLEPGVEYMLSGYVKSDVWPPGRVQILDVLSTPPWASTAGGGAASPKAPGVWTEFNFYFVANPAYTTMSIRFIRTPQDGLLPTTNIQPDVQAGNPGPLWIDDVKLVKGTYFETPKTTKQAFSGSKVRFDALGNFEWNNGTAAAPQWEPWVPMCLHTDYRADSARYATYKQLGFDCDIWGAQNPSQYTNAKNNGMRSFMQIAQYIAGTSPSGPGWCYNNIPCLQTDMSAVLSSANADIFAGFYWDNENAYREWAVPKQVTETIKATDVDSNGQRRHPIIELNGAVDDSNIWAYADGKPFSDYNGAYNGGNTGGAGGALAAAMLIDRMDGNERPGGYCQINLTDTNWRGAVYSCLAVGSRFFSTFSDGQGGSAPIDASGNADKTQVAAEVKQLIPFIRAPHFASWSMNRSDSLNIHTPVDMGVRDFTGTNLAGTRAIGGAIFSNVGGSATNFTYQLTGSPATSGTKVIDYFTNELLATVDGSGRFVLPLTPRGAGTGTRVVIFSNSSVAITPTPTPSITPIPTATPTPQPTTPPVAPPNPSTYAPAGTIDDNNAAFAYSSTGWDYYPGPSADTNLYGGGNHTTTLSPTGGIAKLAFSGTGIRLYGVTDTMFGKFNVSIDGGASQTVDLYSASRAYNALMFEKTGLASGNHILTLTAMGTHNASASDNYVAIDKAEILANGATPTPTPTPTCTKLGDANCDGRVNNLDLNTVLANYGKRTSLRSQGDLTSDGVVNVFDLSQVLQNWGR